MSKQQRDQRDSTPTANPVIELTTAAPPPLRSGHWRVYQWLDMEPQSGPRSQHVFTDPPATYAEMRHLYPNAAGIIPLES